MLESLERQLIYFPTRVPADAPVPRVPGAASVEEVWLESAEGARIHGIYSAARRPFGDLLFFHGNAGSLYDRLANVAMLVEAGLNVLIIDYQGYGKSEGRPSESALYQDGAAAYRHLVNRRGAEPGKIVLFGRSLGSTVAIELGMRESVGAIIVESGFTSAEDLARVHYGWLPGALLRNMTHEFGSIDKVGRLRAPALFVHGDRDNIVPLKMGQRLYEASAEPKEWYEIEGAGHNDTVGVGGSRYMERLVGFMKKHVGAD